MNNNNNDCKNIHNLTGLFPQYFKTHTFIKEAPATLEEGIREPTASKTMICIKVKLNGQSYKNTTECEQIE